MSSREDIDKMLESLRLSASDDIVRAIDDVANAFLTSGGYGSPHMHKAIDEKVTAIYQATATVMAMQARRFAGGGGEAVRDLVDTHLSYLIDQTINRRTEHMETGKTAAEDTAMLCAQLRQDLKRVNNATVRDLRPEL